MEEKTGSRKRGYTHLRGTTVRNVGWHVFWTRQSYASCARCGGRVVANCVALTRGYAATVVPSRHVARRVAGFLSAPQHNLLNELVQTPRLFARNCCQAVDYVVACIDAMPEVLEAAVSLHAKLTKERVNADTEHQISEMREGIHDTMQIILTFNEFISPTARPAARRAV